MEQIDLFFPIFRFTPLWLLVDFILIFHFLFSWFYNYKKTGWKLDIWYFSLFMLIFIPFLLIYPFSASIGNIPVMGVSAYYRSLSSIDKAFIIAILGYINIWLGRYIYNIIGKNYLSIQLFKFTFGWLENILDTNIRDKKLTYSLGIFTLILLILLFVFQVITGNLLNPRDFFMKNPSVRPLYLIMTTLFPFAFSYLSIRYIQYKHKYELILLILLTMFSIFLGTRGATIGVLLSSYVFYLYSNYKKVNLLKTGLIGAIILFIAIYMSSLRTGNINPISTIINLGGQIFYGNNFSDLRDFAWILSYWDGEFVLGKTYIAALMSFIPRTLSDYRGQWALSVYTDRIVGFDPDDHPGLRPGIFGEVYLNFGFIGVIILGVIYGMILRYSDLQVKEYIDRKDIIGANSKTASIMIINAFTITAAFWGLYISLIINIILYFIILFKYILYYSYNKLSINNN